MKKVCIIIISICFLLVLYFYFPDENKSKDNISINNYPQFDLDSIKLNDDEQKTISITNKNNYNLSFKTSDPSKIRILTSSNNSITIEKVKPFSEASFIALFVEGYEKVIDSIKVTCFNEIININNVTIYKKSNKETVERYDEDEYIIDFDLTKLDESKDYEEDTIITIKEYLKKELAESPILLEFQTHIKFSFYLEFDYVFIKTNYKTLFFNLNKEQFALTLYKAI